MRSVESISHSASFDRKAVFENALHRRILDMSMAPGSAVDEVALSKEFGLSRSPVREVLRQLAGEGYIEMAANRAPRVAPLPSSAFKGFAQSCGLIYVATAHLAAANASAADVTRLRNTLQQLEGASQADNHQACAPLESALQLRIGLISENPFLTPSLKRLLIDHARIQQLIYRWQTRAAATADMGELTRCYARLIDAIASHDVSHTTHTCNRLIQLIHQRVDAYLSATTAVREAFN